MLAAGLLAASAGASAGIACMQRGGDALPIDAHPLPVQRAGELQQMLDAHHAVRLDPGGDYRHATGIRLRSGQALYGAAGTRLGRLIIEPGTTGAVLSGVVPESLEFPPSRISTHHNCFERFGARGVDQAPLSLRDVVVEDNLFLDSGQILIDTSRGGSVRNNRFIRTVVHGNSPALRLEGRPNGTDSNVFLWTNVMSAVGDAVVIRRQSRVNLLGLDAEDWNSRGEGSTPAMLSVQDAGALRVVMAQGGDSKPHPGRFMDLSADFVRLVAPIVYHSATPAIVVRGAVSRFESLMSPRALLQREWTRKSGWEFDAEGHAQFDADAGLDSAAESRVSWEAPVFASIPDPAGPRWRRERKSATDSTDQLQRLIDEQGIARLPPGRFHISRSLRLRRGQGIIGAGAGRTVIIASRDDIDMIVGDDHLATPSPTSLVLIDLTLQGGRVGVLNDAVGSGPGAQYVHTQISHVVFRDLSVAGILIDGIYGWDNNLLDEVTFLRVPIGLEQRPNPAYVSAEVSGNIAGTNYFDKNVCYRCRFEAGDVGMRLIAKRADNLNACVNCLFTANRSAAIQLRYANSTLIANTDFIGNGGNPMIEADLPVALISSRFRATGAGSLLGSGSLCEACEFRSAEGVGATVSVAGGRVMLLDSVSHSVALGNPGSALVIESRVQGLSPASISSVSGATQRVLRPGIPTPAPSLLVDWRSP